MKKRSTFVRRSPKVFRGRVLGLSEYNARRLSVGKSVKKGR